MYHFNKILAVAFIILLTGCSIGGEKKIKIFSLEKPREKLDDPMPTPLQMEEIYWHIITSKSAQEVFKKLEEAGITALYEKRRFELLEGFYFPHTCVEPNTHKEYVDNTTKVRSITYTPDFVDPHGKWIIECKGYANERFPLKWKMFMELMMKQEDPPVLFVPRNQGQNITTVAEILEIMSPGPTVL